MKILYFVHPETKGRVKVRVPASKAEHVARVLKAHGYCQVSRTEYSGWVKRHPIR